MTRRSDLTPEVQPEICPECDGEGWILDHEDECYETGDCNCTGVQIECPRCCVPDDLRGDEVIF